MHHKQESLAMLSSILPDKPALYCNAATQDAWSAQRSCAGLLGCDDVDVAVRGWAARRQPHSSRHRNPISSSSWRRHRLDAAGIYQRGLMVGRNAGTSIASAMKARSSCTIREQSCTAGRNAFFDRHEIRCARHVPPQLPGSPSYLRPGTPTLAKFLLDLGYNTGEFGKNHLGDHTERAATRMVSRNSGLPVSLDAMQGVSFPDITRPHPTDVAPAMQEYADPGIPEVAGAVDPKNDGLPDASASRPVVHVGWFIQDSAVHRPGPADARAIEGCRRGNLTRSSTSSIAK